MVECELTRAFGVEWIPRADGRGNEIRGISQAQMDAYSTRTVQMREKERELARAWERKHGRAPTSRELLHLANAATPQSRRGVWAPRELRHTFVSVMSESGVVIEEITRLVGHASSRTTETVYR